MSSSGSSNNSGGGGVSVSAHPVASAIEPRVRRAETTTDANNHSKNNQQQHWESMHVVRRLYGPENANVRQEIAQIEERMERYQTGVAPDPDHIVPYDNHPLDRRNRNRRALQQTNNNNNATTQQNNNDDNDNFKPIRIVFQTQALDEIRDSTNAAKIDWYKREILPATAQFWSQALQVIPVSGRLRVSSTELDGFSHCGDAEFTEVPNSHKSSGVANADLILYVSGSDAPRFCPSRTLAVAVPCNFDQFDRPTAGAINVCLDNIVLQEDGTATPDVVRDYVDVTIHEVCAVVACLAACLLSFRADFF